MARTVPIEQKYTLTPDKAPAPGSLGPGEVAWELASTPIKQWIGVPSSVNVDRQVLLTLPVLPEPLFNGAYLRVKSGATFDWVENPPGHWVPIPLDKGTLRWDNLIVQDVELGGEFSLPVLHFTADHSPAAILAAQNYGGAPSLTLSAIRNEHNPAYSEYFYSAAASMYVLGSAPGLLIDNAGDRSGIFIDSDGQGSRGVEIRRGPNAGPSLRFIHKFAIGAASTPTDYLLGDIVFAGITQRSPLLSRGDGACIQAVSSEVWSPTARGSRLEFLTTANGTQAPRKALVIDHDGGLQVMHNGALTALDSLLGGLAAPTGPLVSSNGTALGSLAVGDNLGVTGTFPSQTLRVTLEVGATEHATWLGADALATLRISGSWEDNVAIGNGALMNCTGVTASGITAVGAWALWQSTTGSGNTALGFSALANNIAGSSNTAIGGGTLGFCVNGNGNVGLGAGAGSYYGSPQQNLTAPTNSIYLGSGTKSAVIAPNNEIVIGYHAMGNGSNTVTLGNDDIIATYLRGDIYINGVQLEFGDPDSAGAGYRVLRVPN